MKRYEIICTPEQTKKALELGAPIEIFGSEDITRDLVKMATSEGQLDELEKELNDYNHATIIGELAYCIPTAEQMICWLEEQEPIKEVAIYRYERITRRYWCYDIFDEKGYCLSVEEECFPNRGEGYSSRKESTLAAIDVALEYLISKKK